MNRSGQSFQSLEKRARKFPIIGKLAAAFALAAFFLAGISGRAGAATADQERQAGEAYRSALAASDSAFATGDTSALKNAINLAKRATDLAPTVPEYWLLLGRLSARAANDKSLAKEAEAALRNGLALKPGSAGGHMALGSFYFLQNRFEEALQEFETAVYISPALVTPPVIAAMCRAYSDRNEWARAENFFTSVVRDYPEADIARLALAVIYREQGKEDRAESEMRRVIIRSEAPESNAECAWRIMNNWRNETLAK